MSGWLTNGVPSLTVFSGSEQGSFDTELSNGESPQTGSLNLLQIATMCNFLANSTSKTLVAGSRYYGSFVIGTPWLLTGISALIGTQGGTDKFIYELHNSAGVLVATTALAGVTVGTGGTYQQIPFTAQYAAVAGTYFIAVQTNGTTANLACYNAPTAPAGMVTGSATGAFGTSASITPPTTYTAGLAPVALVY